MAEQQPVVVDLSEVADPEPSKVDGDDAREKKAKKNCRLRKLGVLRSCHELHSMFNNVDVYVQINDRGYITSYESRSDNRWPYTREEMVSQLS